MPSDVMCADKHHGWIVPFTGRRFYPLLPNVADVCVADIAHALSMMCRWGGHVKQFYSVAQHSVLLAKHALEVEPISSLAAMLMLFHDAAEAYFADICRPVKELLPNIRDIEQRLDNCIAESLGLPIHPGPLYVKELDDAILEDERSQLTAFTVAYPNKLNIKIGECWQPERAEALFLEMYERVKRC